MLDYFFYNTNSTNFPKYDLYVDATKNITLEVALAGYKKSDLEVLFQNNKSELVVKTVDAYKSEDTSSREYISRSLAKRKFKLVFNIRKSYDISSCKFEDGLLEIVLHSPKELAENYQVHIE